MKEKKRRRKIKERPERTRRERVAVLDFMRSDGSPPRFFVVV